MSEYLTVQIHWKVSNDVINSKNISLVKRGNKVFHNAQHLLLELNQYERCFYDYLCEQMDKDNSVYIDQPFKSDFLLHYSKVRKKKKSLTIEKLTAFTSKLKKLGLLLENNSRSYYTVNPKYAHNGSEKDRVKLMQELIYERLKTKRTPEHLIDIPVDKFLEALNQIYFCK
jgi:hypothetical protein